MGNKKMFSIVNYFGKYEVTVRGEIGKELDDFKNLINQIENRCTIRMMNINFKRPKNGGLITVEDLTRCDSDYRCKTLAALLYNESLWRLEAAHLMVCIGFLNVAFTNLRASLDALLTAFIVERCNEQASLFLENKDVNLKLAEDLVSPEYDKEHKAMKDAYSSWGAHTNIESLRLSSLYGASRFDKYVIESTKIQKSLQLPNGFADAAKTCIKHCVWVGFRLLWLESIPVKI